MTAPASSTALGRPSVSRNAQRVLITPEGVPLPLEIAGAGLRFAALCIDAGLILLIAVLLSLVAVFAAGSAGRESGELVAVIWMVGVFALRNAYFLSFELSARAATPGKRALGLRVATRDGGRLTPDAVFVRNAMRELELFLPLMLLASAPRTGAQAWVYAVGLLWCAVFAFLPLFNRDRLRVGDIVAGTWVVKRPVARLVSDMAEAGAVRAADYGFTPAQLDVYGVRELQALEEALRTGERRTLQAIAERVSRKIGIDASNRPARDFLEAYYHAARGRMESRLLMGRRRRDKFDAG